MFPRARVTLLADSNQAILNSVNTQSEKELAEIYDAKTLRLNKSYRSTEQINEFASSFLPEENRYEIFKRSGEEVRKIKGDMNDFCEYIKSQRENEKIIAVKIDAESRFAVNNLLLI